MNKDMFDWIKDNPDIIKFKYGLDEHFIQKLRVDKYVDVIMNQLYYWIKEWKLESPAYKVSREDLKEFKYDMLKPIIEDILFNQHEIVLSDDFCFGLVKSSIYNNSDYRDEIYGELNYIRGCSDVALAKVAENYMKNLCYTHSYNSQFRDDKTHNYQIGLMNEDVRKCYNICLDLVKNVIGYNGHEAKNVLLKRILFFTYGYCYINNKIHLFEILIKKYFDNPDKTFDHFMNNGFIVEKSNYAFIEYVTTNNFEDYLIKGMHYNSKIKEIK